MVEVVAVPVLEATLPIEVAFEGAAAFHTRFRVIDKPLDINVDCKCSSNLEQVKRQPICSKNMEVNSKMDSKVFLFGSAAIHSKTSNTT